MNYIIYGICILIIFIWFFYRDKKNYNRAPKKIWTYWDDPRKIPKTVELCMASWKKYHPEYEIVFLTKKNYKGYVTIPEELLAHQNMNDIPRRFSDLICLWILTEHGGIWMDPTILLKGSIETWLFPHYAEYSGFYLEGWTRKKEFPVIENWFMACNKGSPFIKKWRDEFSNMAHFQTVGHYILSLRAEGVDFQGIGDPHELAIHAACQKVLQKASYPLETLYLQKAEDGPFRYLAKVHWDSEKGVELACHDPTYQAPIMNLREGERDVLEKRLDHDLTMEKCGWI
jgi:Capsular polysaccharide synthesis protein